MCSLFITGFVHTNLLCKLSEQSNTHSLLNIYSTNLLFLCQEKAPLNIIIYRGALIALCNY